MDPVPADQFHLMHSQLYWYMPVPLPVSAGPYFLPPPLPQPYPSPSQIPPLLSCQNQHPLQHLPAFSVPTKQRRHFKRRSEVELNKCHKCPYANCHKDYASDLALNLHMKNKHQGGNKKQRDRAAKMILKSEMQGKPAPQCDVNLPPGYIQANKIRLLLLQTEDENDAGIKREE